MSRPLVLITMLTLALVTVSPSVAAQAPAPLAPRLALDIGYDVEKLHVPAGSEHWPVDIQVRVRCLEPTVPATPIRIDHQVTVDKPWATVTLERTEQQIQLGPEHCLGDETLSYTLPALVAVDAHAPAFDVVTATVQATPDDDYQDTFEAALHFRAGFSGGIEVYVPQSTYEVPAGEMLHFPVTVTNEANGPVQVEMERLEGGTLGTLLLPGGLGLDAADGALPRNSFQVGYLGDTAGTDLIRLRLLARSLDDRDVPAGQHEVEIVIHVADGLGSVYNELPGVSPLVVLGVLAMGLARRRP